MSCAKVVRQECLGKPKQAGSLEHRGAGRERSLEGGQRDGHWVGMQDTDSLVMPLKLYSECMQGTKGLQLWWGIWPHDCPLPRSPMTSIWLMAFTPSHPSGSSHTGDSFLLLEILSSLVTPPHSPGFSPPPCTPGCSLPISFPADGYCDILVLEGFTAHKLLLLLAFTIWPFMPIKPIL